MSKKSYFIVISVCVVFLVIIMGILLGLNNNEIILTISSNIDNNQVTIKVSKGTTVDLNNYNKTVDGYEFIGWYNDQTLDSIIETTHVATSDKTIYAGYSKVVNINEINNIKENSISYTVVSNNENKLTDEHLKILLNNGARRLDLSRCKYKNNEFNSIIFNGSYITHLIFPENIKMIKEQTFVNCYNLKEIELTNKLLKVESKAIYNCLQLESIIFKEGVEEIYENAISVCPKLKKINLPSTVNLIQTNFVTNCESLSEITIDDNNQTYTSIDGIVYSKDLKRLIKCPQNKKSSIKINDNVENINNFAFKDSCISDIIFNNNLKNIGISSFENCKNLKNIIIPDLDNYKIESSCFKDCSNLVSVRFGKGLKSLDENVFKNCRNLKSVSFSILSTSNNIEKIGKSAFENCIKLKKFNIPESVHNLGDNIFYNCEELESVIIQSQIESLPKRIFYGCKALKSVDITNELLLIEDFAFYNCITLKNLENLENVKDIGKMVFYNCESLESLNLSNVQTVGDSNFHNCLSLKELIVTSIKEIKENYIYNCPNLRLLITGKDLENIEDNSLLKCNKVQLSVQNNTNFNIENDIIISKDGKIVFWYNDKNEEINIPSTVEKIYNYAFSGKENLININVSEENKNYYSINGLLFSKDDKLLCYPSGLKNTKLEIDSYVNEISKYSIQSKFLTNIIIPDTIKYIQGGSIINTNINSITLPFLGSSLNSINDKFIGYIFNDFKDGENITYLSNKNLPNSLQYVSITKDSYVGDYAFYGADFIKSIYLYESVNTIKNYAFYNCKSIEIVKAYGAIVKIEEYAFGKNNNLNTIYLGYNNDLTIDFNSFNNVKTKINIYITYSISEIIDINAQTIYKNKFINSYQNSKYWTWRFINNEK